ncbi:MAG: 50S ribosomal protein L22 [candidate division WOR-3 bacterium]|nr:50S ribosomal protein L22 [candidate division WOR-3 bacterium]MDH5683521.1 50S ribosomal protein L22 [candidate division WOR-3 bacterium]
MEAKALSRYQRVSAKKINRILELIRGRDVPEAFNILTFLAKPTKQGVLKTLNSAVANAIVLGGKAKLSEKDLYVKEAVVNGGPMMKRWQAGPRGSASIIRHRTCHIYIVVASKEGVKK